METLKTDGIDVSLALTEKEWREFKRKVEKELYKEKNGHADYEEIKLYFSAEGVDIEAHMVKE